jgi:hypothetical protein
LIVVLLPSSLLPLPCCFVATIGTTIIILAFAVVAYPILTDANNVSANKWLLVEIMICIFLMSARRCWARAERDEHNKLSIKVLKTMKNN